MATKIIDINEYRKQKQHAFIEVTARCPIDMEHAKFMQDILNYELSHLTTRDECLSMFKRFGFKNPERFFR